MKMKKNDLLEILRSATKAAKCANPDVSRCVEAIDCLKEAPASLACDIFCTTNIGKYYDVLTDHKNPKIRAESRLVWDLWLSYLYATGRKQSKSKTMKTKKKQVTACNTTVKKPDMDSKRDRMCEAIQKSLAKVATEVIDTEMKKRVNACDPWLVATSVESIMFEKLGCFLGPKKAKYRSILFNMGDSNNPDLRRKVLIGEISGERLVTMENHEMASDKIQMEVAEIKEKARLREDNRIKMMLQSQLTTTSLCV